MQYIGKIAAYVTDNDWTNPECPYKGCIRVIIPDFYGCEEILRDGSSYSDWIELPEWVEPCFSHPCDFYVPALGEPVYIESLNSSDEDLCQTVWTGFYSAGEEDYDNIVSGVEQEAVSSYVGDITDRVIGTRNGSVIKIEDKDNGKLIIEVFGKNIGNPSRKGHKITLDPAVGLELLEKGQKNKITITAQNIVVDDSENGNKITIDSSGIVILDKNGNTATFSSSGVEIEDATGNKIQMESGGITIDASGGSSAVVKGTTLDMLGATEAFLKGTTFDTWLQLFITWATTHTHICSAPGVDSAPPTIPPAACTGHLSTTIKGE